jgi:flagellar biogenesis protein FliO
MQAMDFLERLLGINLNVTMRTLIAFAVVLVLIVLVAWVFRRVSRGAGRIARRGRLTRLAVLEAIQIDPRRRLVLFRRDNTEHLILVGGSTDLVVEQGIHRAPRPSGVRGAERVEPVVRPPGPAHAPEPPPPERRPAGPAAPADARPADKSVTERQLADMADRLKAALRGPPEGGAAAESGRKPEPAGSKEEEEPESPGGTRRSE